MCRDVQGALPIISIRRQQLIPLIPLVKIQGVPQHSPQDLSFLLRPRLTAAKSTEFRAQREAGVFSQPRRLFEFDFGKRRPVPTQDACKPRAVLRHPVPFLFGGFYMVNPKAHHFSTNAAAFNRVMNSHPGCASLERKGEICVDPLSEFGGFGFALQPSLRIATSAAH